MFSVCANPLVRVVHVVFGRKGDRIYHQLRKSGCSLDWSRTFFTMDKVGLPLLSVTSFLSVTSLSPEALSCSERVFCTFT